MKGCDGFRCGINSMDKAHRLLAPSETRQEDEGPQASDVDRLTSKVRELTWKGMKKVSSRQRGKKGTKS